MVHPSTNSDDPEAWFGAIGRRDWITAEQLIRSYDFKKYRPYNSATRKPAKKLRVLKYLPSKDRKGEEDEQVGISPLLLGDSQGRTPLHLACKEFMPWKLLQSLFFLERNAVFVTDDDGRLPLHLALIASHDIRILDRLIHAHPASLLHPDKLARTPMGYAILRAEHKRDKAIQGTWRIPTQQEQRDWQTQQAENWKNVQFLLDAFVARRKLLSKDHEAPLLIHALEAFAPPSVMNDMLSVSARILQQDDVMAERLLQMLVSLEYPIAIIHKALKICLEIIPRTQLMSCIRRGMMEHYDRGCFPCYQGVCFRTDLLQAYKRKQVHQGELVLGDATQEWWDMLKFLIGFSSSASLKTHTLDETYLLHASLLIPDSPARLVELLVRLFPHARFEEDPETNALPIHLACQYWNSNGKRNYEYSMEKSIVLKMMVTGDSTLVRKRYHRRYPLHLAILSGQSWRFIQTILSLHPKVLSVPDHWTRLYPFQLAAMNISSEIPDPKYNTNDRSSPSDSTFGDRNENHQLDMIYQLLRMNPVAVSPILSCGSGDPSGDLGLVAQHVLSWCYSYKNHGWILNQPRSEALRWAISEGVMPKSRSIIIWFNQLKVLIWKMYDLKNTDKRIAYMPHEDVYLLHAALSHSGTPPIAIELMLMLFPKSIAIPIPGTDEYPIHLAAKSPSYAPMPFETVPITSILEMIILANPKTVSLVSNGRNILQIAIDAGKTWQELYPIVQNHRSLLKQRDPSTGLFPFQQVASCKSFLSLQDWMHVKTFAMKWTDRTPAENGLMIRRFQRKYQQEKTTTIFEMLRAQPRVLEMCTL